MDYREHSTIEGQRWDQIADLHYGDPTQLGLLIQANPQAPITPTLPGGLLIAVPLIEDADLVDPVDLPPWKR